MLIVRVKTTVGIIGTAADLAFEPERVALTIRRSKTDHESAGASVVVPLGGKEATCPPGRERSAGGLLYAIAAGTWLDDRSGRTPL